IPALLVESSHRPEYSLRFCSPRQIHERFVCWPALSVPLTRDLMELHVLSVQHRACHDVVCHLLASDRSLEHPGASDSLEQVAFSGMYAYAPAPTVWLSEPSASSAFIPSVGGYMNPLRGASYAAILGMIISLMPALAGAWFAIRPSERLLSYMRPLSLAGIFA